ncbi:methyltransferase [Thermodesulfobacteriota bacterium]
MSHPAVQEESGERISFWWSVTSSAIALAHELVAMGDLSGQRVVELGCGLGLAGVTAGKLGARVLFTDYVPEALELAERNCGLNGLATDKVEFKRLDWEEPGELGSFDLVLGSEILYDYFFHGSLIKLLGRIVEPEGVLMLADRTRLVVSRFIGRLRGSGFECSETVRRVRVEGFPEQEISVFCLSRERHTDTRC